MKRNALRLPALVLFGIYAIYSMALIPLYQFLSADFVLSDTIFWDIVDFFLNLFEVLGIAAAIGFVLHSIYRYGAKKCYPIYILTGGALLFKYVASIIAISIVGGSLDLTADFSSYLISILMELAELGFMVFLGHRLITGLAEKNRTLKNAADALGKPYTPAGQCFPLQGLFHRINPMQRSAFWGMICVAALRLISFIVGEIAFSFVGYGFAAKDIPIILLYAILFVFLPAFLGYLLSLGCMQWSERFQKLEQA